jgi:hypothetical protein
MNKHLKEIEDRMTLARQNYQGPFCCLDMDLMLEESDPLYNIKYNSTKREYYLKSLEGPYMRTIEFCPWCGSQLPKNLRDEWFDILEQEYGIDDPGWPEQLAKVPADFLTDEWWKKRGL